jgi:hypothetical protein
LVTGVKITLNIAKAKEFDLAVISVAQCDISATKSGAQYGTLLFDALAFLPNRLKPR